MGRWLARIPILLVLIAAPASAQDRETPYWASLKFDEVNMRVGPGERFPIDWVYRRKGLPVKVVRLKDGWRLVQDFEGTQGWILESQLRLERTAIVVGDGVAAIRADPVDTAPLRWNAEPGVSGAVGKCESTWCRFDVSGRSGWMRKERLWGAGDP